MTGTWTQVLDSCLTVKRDWLTEESKSINDLQDIMIANKSKVQVVSWGNVSITTIVGKHKYNVLIKDVTKMM